MRFGEWQIIVILIANNYFGCRYVDSGGAGSEVWNRVYMIAPVKKFGRVRLSTIFPSKLNMAGNVDMEGR